MAMKRCPDCGEKYSDTYKRCPFCEEEEALREGERVRRGGRRAASRGGRQSYSLVTPTLIVLIAVMSALLIYLLFGDRIGKDKPKEPDTPPAQSQVQTPAASSSLAASSSPAASTPGTMPEDPSVVVPDVAYDTVNNLPSGLSLNKTDFTFSVGDPEVQLRADGGNGNYTWVSQDPNIASVDAGGKVRAISGGTVNVLVSDGNRKGTCIVRVKGGSAPASPSTPATPSTPSTSAKLNKTDYTTKVGEMSVQLTVQGTTSTVTWASKDSSIATVSDKGLVKAVGKGTTTITATVDGTVLECIVRVKG